MKNKKWISLAAAVILAVTALPLGVFAAKKDEAKLAKVTLNEVAHSIFYAPQYVAIEEGYFKDEGLDMTLITGFGADKTMTAVISGEADIGFMGAEASIYAYQEGATDPVVNFAQLTQRAGNFLVAREEMPDFKWEDLKDKKVLGGRKGGMPEMVFEYILKKNNIDPKTDLSIDQSIDFGSTAAAFSGGQGDFSVEFEPHATSLEEKGDGYVVASLGESSGYVPYTAFSAKKSYIKNNENNLKEIALCGCCTDLCVMNFAIPLKNYINENDLDIDVVIYKNAVETYDAPNHNRKEYNEIAFKIMEQNGIKLI